jgi:two-component system CheB/CheR fusion protein
MKVKKKKGEPARSPNTEEQPCAAETSCPLVALGASAGGLEVFGQFFERMPIDSGLSFVLVQHLDPSHDTLMPELLAKHTQMTVSKVEDGMPIEPNHVYVIAPNGSLRLEKCVLRVDPLERGGDAKAIDGFFRSAAFDQNESVIGVILSGTGADGTLGLKAIKERGGLTIAQDPATAKFDGMPRHAIESGFVDFVLPLEQMAEKVIQYGRHLQALQRRKGVEALQQEIVENLPKICPLLRKRTGHDFSRYKESTLARRIQRRMQVRHLDTALKYVECLSQNDEELDALFKDLLISVTQFFRDPDSFEAMTKRVLPDIFRDKGEESQVRIWVAGCATGEEAYSLAISCAEFAEKLKRKPKIQIFATDLDAEALEMARKGKYSVDIENQMSPQRLRRFFRKVGDGYELVDAVRETCVFSLHNLIKDPPFSRLDLITCRNVLIYLEADLQRKLLPLFHYALNPSGFLFLGPSENVAGRSELFKTADSKHRLFQRRPAVLHAAASVAMIDPGQVTRLQTITSASIATQGREPNVARSIERMIVEEYAPASVVINEQGEVVYFAGDTGKFLKPPSGSPSNKLVAMARENLRLELRTLVHRAISTRKEAVRENLRIKKGKETLQLDLIVRPATELGAEAGLYVVLFRELIPAKDGGTPATEDFASHEHPIIKQLEGELRTTRENLQTTIEELETSNEELKSANEELLSMNEELQSANEELQTSKEEVQSANDELQRKIEEADQANVELRQAHQERAIYAAIVENSDDAIIGKTLDGIITNWNRAAERIFGFSADEIVGQSILRIIPPERHEEEGRILQKLRRGDRVEHYETERITKSGRTIPVSLTASPIRDPHGFIVGASKIARDISGQKAAARSTMLLAAIVDSSDDAIVSKTLEGVVTSWNQGAERLFGYTSDEMVGQPITKIFPPDRLEEETYVLSRIRAGQRIEHFETIRRAKDGTLLDIALTISPIRDPSGKIVGASKIARDITVQKVTARASQLLAAIVDSSDDAIVSKRLDGTVTSWNRAAERLFGYTAEEMIGQPITRLFPEDRLEEEPKIIERIGKGERVENFETTRKAKDGRLISVSLTISPVKDAQGQIVGASKIARDVSRQKEMEEALRKAKDQLEQRVAERTASLRETTEQLETFCYTVAHDLRSPLRAQQTFAQALIDDYKDQLDEEGRGYTLRILRNAERLDRLVNDLLTYSRLTRGELKFENVSLAKVVAEVRKALAHDIESTSAKIETGAMQSVFAYEPTLNLIITNLIGNAMKFVKAGERPAINVRSEERDGTVRLWVEDQGIGIHPEGLDKVFGIFHRLHPVDKYPGTGIGLAIVQKGAERMGGKAGVESELGKGSRFWVDLPAARRISSPSNIA